ncbi:hypothetical protein L6164_017339 [Bauhinia variegata]|uniref:Uncharacterized protein n=1 Tax=Bauhinia variegata TaxID=167791 RepID=A0ACB9N8C2_BAUVA|nr:hypothetical protein L6164_017339 [Bauhinia variegata]
METDVVFLIGKVISLLESEVSLIGNFGYELRELQHELQSMRSFLEDAHSTPDQTEQDKTWVAQVRESAIELQDIIDEFTYHKNKLQASRKFTRFFHQAVNFPLSLRVKHQVGFKLQQIKGAVNAISERRNRYGGVNRPQGSQYYVGPYDWLRIHHESSLFLRDDEVVGFDEAKDKIRELLMDEVGYTVISILGAGGSGKTTLAANAFNNSKIKQHFYCCAWVTISQRYDIEDIFRSLIKDLYKSRNENIPQDLCSMDHRSLVETIVSHLKEKRYLLVLDDVWNPNLWGQISIALPEGHGRRLMLTTRFDAIASYAFGVQSYLYRVEPLKEDKAFHLFCKKAFTDECCPNNLEPFAKSLVDKCEGLPLALVALGGSMSSKKLESEWERVDRSLNWYLSNNPELQNMKIILLLSYYALPYRLKLCFLNCCVFPEDYLMKGKRLIRLWLAEGFLEHIIGLTPEEVGEMCLTELVRRSLLLVVKSNPHGQTKTCRMHDILRELAISISTNENFCIIYKNKQEIGNNSASVLAIQEDIQQSWPQLCNNFPKVRLNINKVPDGIEDCYNLGYLNLAETNVTELPKSIGRLCQLHTLNLKNTYIQVLPSRVTRLHNLRCLLVYHDAYLVPDDFTFASGVRVPTNISRLVNLQVLTFVEANGNLVRKLRKLSNLRTLCLCKVTEEVEEDMCLAIETMKHLQYLVVATTNEQTMLRLDSLSSTPPRLKKLRLLEALPNLDKLRLHRAYTGENLNFVTGFRKLKHLDILCMPQLKQIDIKDGIWQSLSTSPRFTGTNSASLVTNLAIKEKMEIIKVLNGMPVNQSTC